MPSPKVLVPLVAIALLGFWFWNRSQKKVATRTVAEDAPSAPQIISTGAPEKKADPAEKKELQKAKRQFAEEVSLGLKRLKVTVKGSTLAFRIRPKTDGSGCQVGDFDQIKSLARAADERIFYLSLEPMPGSKGKVQKYPITVSDIAGGVRYDVSLEASSGVSYYGTYLCSFEKKKDGCGDKPSMTPKDWADTGMGKRVLDKGIHFQMLAVRGEDVFLLPSQNWDRDSLKKLQKKLEGGDRNLNAAFAKMRTLMDQLASLPAAAVGDTLELNLPFRSSECR